MTRFASDYPKITIDAETYHICPLDDGGYVLLKPEEFATPWWKGGPWIDSRVDMSVKPLIAVQHGEYVPKGKK